MGDTVNEDICWKYMEHEDHLIQKYISESTHITAPTFLFTNIGYVGLFIGFGNWIG